MAIFRKHFIVKSFETSKVTKRKGNDSHINSASQYIIKKAKVALYEIHIYQFSCQARKEVAHFETIQVEVGRREDRPPHPSLLPVDQLHAQWSGRGGCWQPFQAKVWHYIRWG